MTTIADGFNPGKPIACAQGRYGEVIIAQGSGLQPKRWTGSGTATDAGILPPDQPPVLTLDEEARYYVARVDVVKPGAVYHSAPSVTFTTETTQPEENVPAVAAAYLNQSCVGEVIVTNGGKHYDEPPSIELGNSHGTGAILTPIMDGTPPNPSSITHYEIEQGPPFDDEGDSEPRFRSQWEAWGPVLIPLVNGTHTQVNPTVWVFHGGMDGDPTNIANYWLYNGSITYTVSGVKAGASGAVASVNFYGQGLDYVDCGETICFVVGHGPYLVRSVTTHAAGSGYYTDEPVTIEICSWRLTVSGSTTTLAQNCTNKKLIIKGYPPGHSNNTSTPRFSLKDIEITNGGSGYIVAPDIRIDSPSGFGAYATCKVESGAISEVTLHYPGGGYKLPPTVTAVAGEAEVAAVSRPHLRGKYQCYYRYVDDTPEENGGPIPSNLSPVAEVDAGEGAASMTWSVTEPDPEDDRNLTLELWRSTSNQALMLYRVGTANGFVDDLTDEEVRDPDREGYAAMPIVLPNGDLNAMRFVPPPDDKAVVVRYQDRFWYGVDTSGTEPNHLYFSEVDEPESVPDINEFVLQQNARDGDYITALVPFGTSMLVMQSRHAYSLSFSQSPLRDADVTPLAYRGCLHQRCWDIHAGVCYALDQNGLYSVSLQGDVQDLSMPIDDIFRTQVDWGHATWNFVLVDPVTKVVRAFVAFKDDDSTGYPTRALCYSITTKSWWVERYPHRISSGTTIPMNNGDYRPVYGAQGGVYLLGEGAYDAARGAVSLVTLTEKGAGYRVPPKVTAEGGVGAEFQAVLNASGGISGIWILNPGMGYVDDTLVIDPPDDETCTAPVQAEASFTATDVDEDTVVCPVYRYRTGNRAFPNDMTAKTGGSVASRDIVVTYKPQSSKCDLSLRLYYNNSTHARPYVANRNRGVGFVASTVDGAARLDMASTTAKTGYDSGVAKALLANRSVDDIKASDRHVAVEMIGARRTVDPVVIYELDVYGTASRQE